MDKKRSSAILLIDEETSEVVGKIPKKKIKGEYFFMMTLAMATELAKKKGLQGADLRVLLILLGKMEFGKDVRVSQTYIAEELGIRREQVNVSIKHLIAAGVITKTTIDGLPAYSVNVATMGNGAQKNG